MHQPFRNVRAYCPEPLGTLDLLIATDRVVWIGSDPAGLPPSLRVVERDFRGKRAIPGLIDCRVRVTGGGGEAGPSPRVPPVAFGPFWTVDQ